MNSHHLPTEGLSPEQIKQALHSFKSQDVPWATGRAFAYVYEPPADVKQVIAEAYVSYLSENALDPTAFPSLLKMENDVVSIAANLLGGNAQTVGNFTAGGTESIMLALKSARDYFHATRHPSAQPEVILAPTAHAAFFKSCQYLGLKAVLAPVDKQTFRINTEAIPALINENTVLLVGSAPNYSHGVMDDIEALGAMAQRYGLLCHVDACVGGFYLPFVRKNGANVPPFSLEVEGVSSISCDIHKYGYTFKGASLILYKSATIRQYQIYTCSDWAGYSLVNPTVLSSKSGASLAGAWAALHYLGESRYKSLNLQTQSATQQFIEAVGKMSELEVLGQPVMNLVAVASRSANISVFKIAELLKQKGWYVQTQFASCVSKETLHLNINPANTVWVEELIKDLRAVLAILGAASEPLPMYPEGFFNQLLEQFGSVSGLFAAFGIGEQQVPDDFVTVNNLLNQLNPSQRDFILSEFANRMFVAP